MGSRRFSNFQFCVIVVIVVIVDISVIVVIESIIVAVAAALVAAVRVVGAGLQRGQAPPLRDIEGYDRF